MGRPGAYLEHPRREHEERSFSETIHDFDVFAKPLSPEEQQVQASRCMMCGVAFCQSGCNFGKARVSGCPLHNLIPEWNDLVYRGLWDEAAERLRLTNPFPEFTGRVCPALCEAACNLAYIDEATTIRDNERAISDWEWEHGGPIPFAASAVEACSKRSGNDNQSETVPEAVQDTVPELVEGPCTAKKVAVIGSGPCGLGVAWALAQAGIKVTVIERKDRAGGLLMYGIPVMKLPKDIVTRRVTFLEEQGVEFRLNTKLEDCADELKEEFDAIVMAVGAPAARTVNAPGFEKEGVVFAVDYLTENTKAILENRKPEITAEGKDVIVIGGGDTGTDCLATALRQGAKSVHQLEYTACPPEKPAPTNQWPEWPFVKKTDYGQQEAIAAQGSECRIWSANTSAFLSADECSLTPTAEVCSKQSGNDDAVAAIRVCDVDWTNGKPEDTPGTCREMPAQLVLIACGFTGPEAEGYQALGVEIGNRNLPTLEPGTHKCVPAAEACSKRTGKTVPIYAAGDAKNGSTLVVTSLADGLACAREIIVDLQ